MRTGVILPSFEGEGPPGRFFVDRAQQVEDLGFDSLFVGDRLFGHTPSIDPLVALGAYAAATTRITIGTGVLLLALREPAVAAKQVATIDLLSAGRMVFGAGLGGEVAEEWDGMQVPMAERGKRLDEYLEIVRLLWAGRTVDYAGAFRSVHGVVGSPPPARPGGPPIWIGGRSDAAVRRSLRFDGWCAYAVSPRALHERVEQIRSVRGPEFTVSAMVFSRVDDTHDRAIDGARQMIMSMYQQDFRELLGRVGAVGTAEHVADRLAQFRATGVDEVVMCVLASPEDMPRQLERLAVICRGLDLPAARFPGEGSKSRNR